MKAIIINEFGPSAELIYTEVPTPEITQNEVLVKISAISINPVDVKTFEGSGSANKIIERPVILGWDIAGTVTETKSELFEVGDEVFGMIRFPESGKAYAEYVSAPADQLALKPSNVTIEEAAATTLAALTAWQNLTEHYKIQKGQKVLIHAGAGGVGHFAIQIAKYFEAYVYTTASAENSDFVKSLGADETIDHNTIAFEKELKEIDFVFNSLSDEISGKSLEVLKAGGTLISIASDVSAEVKSKAELKQINAFRTMVEPNGEHMKQLSELLFDRSIVADVRTVFPFEQMTEAFKLIKSHKTVGKIVIKF